jgi:hypothetical protein
MTVLEDAKPLGEWTAKYWQWIYSIPKGDNPLETGNISYQTHQGQSFLCLPCTGGGEDCSRVFTMSEEDAKKDILIPVFAAAYSTAELKHDATEDKLLGYARDDLNNTVNMEVSIDGNPLQPYYVESPPFEVQIPSNNIVGDKNNIPSGRYKAMAAGYWYKLKPLCEGQHIIRFGGTGYNGFYTKVQYIVNVPVSHL